LKDPRVFLGSRSERRGGFYLGGEVYAMKPGTFLTLLIITVIFAGVNPIAAAPDREVVGLTGTKWDVFVLEFPLCRDACGGATITF
jgi:hypothetical protein